METSTSLDQQFDEVISTFNQADALLTEIQPSVAHHYFWATSYIISVAKAICEKMLISKLH